MPMQYIPYVQKYLHYVIFVNHVKTKFLRLYFCKVTLIQAKILSIYDSGTQDAAAVLTSSVFSQYESFANAD